MLPQNVALTAAVYAVGGFCYFNLLPWYTLTVVLVTCFSRWLFDIHACTHSPRRYALVEELMLLVMSPLSVGLDEQRLMHLQHHSHLGTPNDPDWFYYNVSPIKSFLFCLMHPEITFALSFSSMSVAAQMRSLCPCYCSSPYGRSAVPNFCFSTCCHCAYCLAVLNLFSLGYYIIGRKRERPILLCLLGLLSFSAG